MPQLSSSQNTKISHWVIFQLCPKTVFMFLRAIKHNKRKHFTMRSIMKYIFIPTKLFHNTKSIMV